MDLWLVLFQVASYLLAGASAAYVEARPGELVSGFEFIASEVKKFEPKVYLHFGAVPEGVEYGFNKMHNLIRMKAMTKVLTHSHKANRTQVQEMVNEYLRKKRTTEFNVFTFDWSYVANLPELQAAIGSVYLGQFFLAQFLDNLNKRFDIENDQIHLIGYGMGAHLMGAGARTQAKKIGRLTALDPYRVFFDNSNVINIPGLRRTDAKVVDVFHTDVGNFGIMKALGTIDVYPNGGRRQLFCDANHHEICNSLMSIAYYAESIRSNETFVAIKCPNYYEYVANKCANNSLIIAGESWDTNSVGTFYFRTNRKSPFSMGLDGAIIGYWPD